MASDWHLVIGDRPALPAIAALMQGVPPTARIAVILEVDGNCAAHCLLSDAAAPYVIRCGYDDVSDVLRTMYLPAGDGEVALFGRASDCVGIRRTLAGRTSVSYLIDISSGLQSSLLPHERRADTDGYCLPTLGSSNPRYRSFLGVFR